MSKNSAGKIPIDRLAPQIPGTENYYAVVETPKGSHVKYKYEPSIGYFRVDKTLPSGAVFPHDFGFIPSTIEEDGDPLDVLVLIDEPSFTGCVVPVRILGVIEANQTEAGKTIRNDRLVAAALKSTEYENIHSLREMDPRLLEELEHFFQSYDEMEGKVFTPIGRRGPNRARKLIDDGVRQLKQKEKK